MKIVKTKLILLASTMLISTLAVANTNAKSEKTSSKLTSNSISTGVTVIMEKSSDDETSDTQGFLPECNQGNCSTYLLQIQQGNCCCIPHI